MEKKRLAFPDVAKGIAILAVILGHSLSHYVTDYTNLLCNFVFSFHMPLFFIVSGYFYSNRAGGITKSARTLLIPYLALALFAFFEQVIVNPDYDIPKHLFSILYANPSPLRSRELLNNLPVIGMEWFLLALFICRLIYKNIDTFGKKYNIPVSLLALCVFITGISLNDHVWLPFSIQPAMGAVLFYHIGYELKQRGIMTDNEVRSKSGVVIISAAIWLCAIFYGYVRVNANLYNDMLSIVGAVCGSFVILLLSKYIAKIPVIGKFLTWAGRYSIVIFCVHKIESALVIDGGTVLFRLASSITNVHSYSGQFIYIIIRVAAIVAVSFIATAVFEIYKKHRAVKTADE